MDLSELEGKIFLFF